MLCSKLMRCKSQIYVTLTRVILYNGSARVGRIQIRVC